MPTKPLLRQLICPAAAPSALVLLTENQPAQQAAPPARLTAPIFLGVAVDVAGVGGTMTEDLLIGP